MVGPAIVELARAAVRRLAGAAPGDDARQALARIERVSMGPPYTIAIAGDLTARTELLNWLAGERLFGPARRDPARIVLSLRRGTQTSLRARRRDGSVEDRTLSTEPADNAAASEPVAPSAPRKFQRGARSTGEPADPAATVASSDAPGVQDAVVRSADAEITALVRRPPWWAVWLWILAWWRAWRSRRSAAAPGAPAPLAATGPVPVRGPLAATVPGPAPVAPPVALPPAPRTLANTVPRGRPPTDPRQHFVDALSGFLADDSVERLFVEVSGGPLPDHVVLFELPPDASALSLDAVAADACLVACGERGMAQTHQLETVLDVVPHLFVVGGELTAGGPPRARRLDSFAAAAAALIQIATIERALAVGARAAAALAQGSAALDAAITGAETEFRARLDRLEALRIANPDDYVAAALARARPAVVAYSHRLIRDALDQLDHAITELGAAWAARLGEASSADTLRMAAAQIDEESLAALLSAQTAARRALIDGLTECARAHDRELVGELRRGTSRNDAEPPWLTVEVEIAELTSSTSLGAVAPRLTSLFRSLDAIKASAAAQLEQRVARLRQLASANVLDAEPRLEPAVAGTIAIALRGEVERHAAWLDAELARERIAIDAERVRLAALAIARDTARSDERELMTAIEAAAAELP